MHAKELSCRIKETQKQRRCDLKRRASRQSVNKLNSVESKMKRLDKISELIELQRQELQAEKNLLREL